jgi:hypothetical protein
LSPINISGNQLEQTLKNPSRSCHSYQLGKLSDCWADHPLKVVNQQLLILRDQHLVLTIDTPVNSNPCQESIIKKAANMTHLRGDNHHVNLSKTQKKNRRSGGAQHSCLLYGLLPLAAKNVQL